MPFGQPTLALAAQLQPRAERAGVPDAMIRLDGDAFSAADDEDMGRELLRLVAKARAAGVDPEMELRAAAPVPGHRARLGAIASRINLIITRQASGRPASLGIEIKITADTVFPSIG